MRASSADRRQHEQQQQRDQAPPSRVSSAPSPPEPGSSATTSARPTNVGAPPRARSTSRPCKALADDPRQGAGRARATSGATASRPGWTAAAGAPFAAGEPPRRRNSTLGRPPPPQPNPGSRAEDRADTAATGPPQERADEGWSRARTAAAEQHPHRSAPRPAGGGGSTLLVVRSLPLATAPQGPDREDRAVRRR